MKFFSLIAALLIPMATHASNITWKDRLYCYGTFLSSSNFVVELKRSIDNDGLEREVLFAKNVNSKMSLVTTRCSKSGDTLTCENDDVSIKVNVGSRYSGGGGWDASNYVYHTASVTKKGFFSDKTEEIRCRL